MKLLTHPNDKISAEVLAFLSMLMYGGNRNVQVMNLALILRISFDLALFCRKGLII